MRGNGFYLTKETTFANPSMPEMYSNRKLVKLKREMSLFSFPIFLVVSQRKRTRRAVSCRDENCISKDTYAQ
uniref:Uncharacterized protein n=1 Tax=Rhizophora mucronata TaxID=61149 RepID=A0A2P2QGQ1_RHIMU